MGMIKCEQGHYYDGNKFFICPQCGIEIELEDIEGFAPKDKEYEDTIMMKKPAAIEETLLMNTKEE